MRRKIKQFLSAICACTVMFTSLSAFAINNDFISAENIFQIALLNIDTSDAVQYNTAQPLYNLADNLVAYMYYLQPQGYIIADDHGRVLEYNLDDNHQFFTNPKEHYCYGGIFSYMLKDTSGIVDLITGNLISVNAMSRSTGIDTNYSSDSFWREGSLEQTSPTLSQQRAVTYTPIREDLNHATRMYNCNNSKNYSYFGFSSDQNVPGVCGSTALAIMTAYLDDYHTDSTHNWCLDTKKEAYASSSYQYGKELVKEIIGYIEPNGEGSFLLGAYTYYLQDHNIWDRKMVVALTENGSWDCAKSSIMRDYPCVVGVGNKFQGVYEYYKYSHFMTVVSVSRTSSGVKYYHVNCGYGTNTNHNGYDKLNANGANIGRVYYLQNC